MTKRANQWKGCKDLVYAVITKDTAEAYETGEVKDLAYIKQVGQGQEQSVASVYADNTAVFNTASGIKFSRVFDCLAIDAAVKAELEGQYAESDSTLVLSSGEAKPIYVAVGYKLYDTDGTCFYVWCLKGTCTFGEETIVTLDDGTDSNGVQMTFNAVDTVHQFTKGGRKAQVAIQENDTKYDTSKFFETVTTPDTLVVKAA